MRFNGIQKNGIIDVENNWILFTWDAHVSESYGGAREKKRGEYYGLPSGERSHFAMERSTIFHGKIHYFDWAIFHGKMLVHQRVVPMIILVPNIRLGLYYQNLLVPNSAQLPDV